MKQDLLEVNDLIGVWGSFICTNQADIIASAPPPGFNKSVLENIARHCLDLLITGGDAVQGLQEVVMYFQERRLFVLDLKQVILVVLCTPSVDISLLRLTINVVTAHWEKDQTIQKQFQEYDVERF